MTINFYSEHFRLFLNFDNRTGYAKIFIICETLRSSVWRALHRKGSTCFQILSSFYTREMTGIYISLKIQRNQRDRPPQRHWFVTFRACDHGVSTDSLRDANVRYTNKVHLLQRCYLFRFSCSAHGYICEGNTAAATAARASA